MASRAKPKAVDFEQIAATNPGVDEELYGKATKLLETLRQSGVRPRDYNLRSPYDPAGLDHAPLTHSPLPTVADTDESSPRN